MDGASRTGLGSGERSTRDDTDTPAARGHDPPRAERTGGEKMIPLDLRTARKLLLDGTLSDLKVCVIAETPEGRKLTPDLIGQQVYLLADQVINQEGMTVEIICDVCLLIRAVAQGRDLLELIDHPS